MSQAPVQRRDLPRPAPALLLFNCAYHLAVLLVAGGCFLLAGLPDLGWGRWLLNSPIPISS